ncbi:TetR/AcrR family transcriptional regulator [Pseudarthrobacter scleromae]|uniref:TetR/AcrR family transcriptional regulator n=1 Tax=Pseudarthrobacter scleromae TaxID=158897 RepID=UPI003D04AA11
MSVRGPYAKSRERKAAITAASLQLVIERGHENVSTAEVARSAGITESSLLYHFPTRDELLVATLTAADPILMANEVDVGAIADPVEVLRSVVSQGMGEPNRLRLFTEMLARASDPTHPAHQYITEHHRLSLAYAAKLLRIRQDNGLAHPDVDPDRFGREIVAIWDGLQAQWLVNRDFDLADAVGNAFRRLCREDVMETKRTMEQLAAGL